MPVAEHNSKAKLCKEYKISASTLQTWLTYLKDNYATLAMDRNEPDYLSFEQYKPTNKTLTPLQLKVFKKHYGEA